MSIRLREVTIGYRRRRRLGRTAAPAVVARDLSAVARPGELTALIGPNGAGKSTLLRTVCGLQPALSGSVTVDDLDVAAASIAELARRIAVVLTERVDPGLLDVREIVGLGRTPHLGVTGRPGPADEAAIDWALDVVGISGLADRMIAELSDGQRQRVMTARALAQQPALLVLDEPTSFLDVPSRVELLDLLARLAREENIAVLVSTHELELALRLADHVWLLNGDGGFTVGDPAALARSGLIAQTFDRGRLHFDPDHLVFTITDQLDDQPAAQSVPARPSGLSAGSR